MASDLKSDLVMTAFQSCPTVHLMGNPAVYTLVFQHHAELVNIVEDNDILTHIVVAIKNSRP